MKINVVSRAKFLRLHKTLRNLHKLRMCSMQWRFSREKERKKEGKQLVSSQQQWKQHTE